MKSSYKEMMTMNDKGSLAKFLYLNQSLMFGVDKSELVIALRHASGVASSLQTVKAESQRLAC
ncbi:hypothetical protein BOO36_10995 [Vibrio navarrensis]|nr:hypothetical protein EA25_11295 [Vibrio navarrensis]MBE4574368.1 hypothetical protein [Vibrio navarrensis]MBE4617308.1 hypothetical protein [Vibrio navarrensis]